MILGAETYGFSAVQLPQMSLTTSSCFYQAKQIISQKGFRCQKEPVKCILTDKFKGRHRMPTVDRQEDEALLDNIFMLAAFKYCCKELDLTTAGTNKFLKV